MEMVDRMDSSSFETISVQENEMDATDQSLGTTVMLPDEKDLLSSQVIVDYFTSDGPRGKRPDASDNEPERSIMDESSGDEELRASGETGETLVQSPDNVPETKSHSHDDFEMESAGPQVERQGERLEGMLEEMLTWELALSLLVVILALAHCMWMWNMVELSALRLDGGD